MNEIFSVHNNRFMNVFVRFIRNSKLECTCRHNSTILHFTAEAFKNPLSAKKDQGLLDILRNNRFNLSFKFRNYISQLFKSGLN